MTIPPIPALPATPPRGLAWTVSAVGRVVGLALACVSLLVSIYVGYLRIELAGCLNDRDLADRTRTAAIADAHDVERSADLALLRSSADAGERERLRAAAIAARIATDGVRAAHPAPDLQPCK